MFLRRVAASIRTRNSPLWTRRTSYLYAAEPLSVWKRLLRSALAPVSGFSHRCRADDTATAQYRTVGAGSTHGHDSLRADSGVCGPLASRRGDERSRQGRADEDSDGTEERAAEAISAPIRV